jgi:2-oxoacid:acceptor oxidoreductase gamma subunit (pyruvate/2-ketoisovalerate family)/2-oxoacid:acceptor oxidoreductase delta subunit (pyruvate/2-ketoisovalerate family)
MELRLHGRGGQGGVTCAKLIAAIFARLGKSVQTFGDYAGERSGAPVRAFARVSDTPITNRNKVYDPDHLIVLDPTLLGAEVVFGLKAGGTLLVNSPKPPTELRDARYAAFRIATVDATAIARRHKIGSRSLVIVNTTIAGALVRALDLPLSALESAYAALGYASNLAAAREAYEAVAFRDAARASGGFGALSVVEEAPPSVAQVIPIVEHVEGIRPALKTGNWRTQTPHYVENLAPCSAFCPAGNDVVGFIQALAQEGEAAAARVLLRTTPLAGVCGRVCPAPCMDGCNRGENDGAVNIRGLERWISDRALSTLDSPRSTSLGARVAIVGGGPAGLSAAYRLTQHGFRPVLFDAEAALGGVLRTGIPAYRLPRDILDREVAAIVLRGTDVRLGQRLDRDAMARLLREFDAVILATGLQRLRDIDGPKAAPTGVEQGIHFLRRVNVDGGVRLSGHVVVLGGGNTAMDCARSALRVGAARVTVAYRRTQGEMPAIREEIDEAMAEGVAFAFLRAPLGYEGEGRVRAVVLAEVDLGEPDASGRRRPVVSSRHVELPCDTVLLALGQSADAAILPNGWTAEAGRIVCDGRPLNVFVAGDFSTGDGTVTHAIGDGRRAADRVAQALGADVAVFERPDRTRAVPATDIRVDHFAPAPPAHEARLDAACRTRDFAEVSSGLATLLEAHRCYSCGSCTKCDTCLVYCPEGIIRRTNDAYAVDYSYCKGCGICAAECPRKAIEMREGVST